eukprot:3922535-Rhodomonas_salina.3
MYSSFPAPRVHRCCHLCEQRVMYDCAMCIVQRLQRWRSTCLPSTIYGSNAENMCGSSDILGAAVIASRSKVHPLLGVAAAPY